VRTEPLLQRPRLRSTTQPLCLPRLQRAEKIPPRLLQATRRADEDDTLIYFVSERDSEACALKPKCCPNVPARKIARSVHEAARDKARAIAKTEAYAVSRRQR
jgi:hypothetical protein